MRVAPRISIDDHICHGKPVIEGTRVMVSVILGNVASGEPFEEIAGEYSITHEDVIAALAFAAEWVDLIPKLEDRIDVIEAKLALQDAERRGTIPHEEVKKRIVQKASKARKKTPRRSGKK